MKSFDGTIDALSVGRLFAQECLKSGKKAVCEFDFSFSSLPNFTNQRKKQRYVVRDLFKVKKPSGIWYESYPTVLTGDKIENMNIFPETARTSHIRYEPELLPTQAWLQVPDEIMNEPEVFASFIAFRLFVRLCTAENLSLIKGPGGLCHSNDLMELPIRDDFQSSLFSACNEIEQMSATPTGIVINPHDYWTILERTDTIRKLEETGLMIVRARCVRPGEVIVGDFEHATVLFDQGQSKICFAEPPEGVFANRVSDLCIKAQIEEKPVITLPGHVFRVSLPMQIDR